MNVPPEVAYHPVMGSEFPAVRFYHIWQTSWGPMAAGGGEGGLVRLILPHYRYDELAAVAREQFGGSSDNQQTFAQLITLTRDYFDGKCVDFSEIPCDLSAGSDYAGRVLRACRDIAYGRTLSYKALAAKADSPRGVRASAGALANGLPQAAARWRYGTAT